MFLFVLFFCTTYLYFLSKYRFSFVLMFPAIFVYSIVSGLQYDVGTDYISYLDIYEDQYRLDFHYVNHEYIFYFIVKILNSLGLPGQSLFLTISFIQGFLFFYFLYRMKKIGINIWLLFFIIFCVTNVYNNQLNLIRQFVSICIMPLILLFVVEGKYFKYFLGVLSASMFHFSSWILFSFIILSKFRLKDSLLIYIFIFSGFFYSLFGAFFQDVVIYLFSNYSHYFNSEYAEGISLSGFLTKLYYLPVILFFFYIYERKDSFLGEYFHLCIIIFTLTYWSFITAMQFGIFERFFTYFLFFYAFPIYYVLNYFYSRKMSLSFFLLFIYILFPYALKTTVFATAEFKYNSILQFIW